MLAPLFPELEAALPDGVALFRARLNEREQRAILDDILKVMDAARPYRPLMPMGARMINAITNCGQWGWHSDARGYRYVDTNPNTQTQWPAIPPRLDALARQLADEAGAKGFEPDACLVNLYAGDGKLNLHQDRDEEDFAWPIVSFSFGAEALFVLGGATRKDRTQSVQLASGDVMVMHGAARLRFHGVKKILTGTAPFAHAAIPPGGRLNLTLRRAH